MTDESCTEVADLGLRRLQKQQTEIAKKLIAVVAQMKDSEMALLRAHIAMEDANWGDEEGFSKESILKIREIAKNCEAGAGEAHEILKTLADELGYEDPFSTGGSD